MTGLEAAEHSVVPVIASDEDSVVDFAMSSGLTFLVVPCQTHATAFASAVAAVVAVVVVVVVAAVFEPIAAEAGHMDFETNEKTVVTAFLAQKAVIHFPMPFDYEQQACSAMLLLLHQGWKSCLCFAFLFQLIGAAVPGLFDYQNMSPAVAAVAPLKASNFSVVLE